MRDYLDLFVVDHTHDEPSDCIGNPNVVPESVVQDYFATLEHVNLTDLNHRRAEITDQEGRKQIVADKIVEDDDAMTVLERMDYVPEYKLYVLQVTPDWDRIPVAVKESKEHMNYLNSLQGKVFEDDDVAAMIDTLTVSNVKVHEGVVEGYDNTSFSKYTYTPVADSKKA